MYMYVCLLQVLCCYHAVCAVFSGVELQFRHCSHAAVMPATLKLGLGSLIVIVLPLPVLGLQLEGPHACESQRPAYHFLVFRLESKLLD